VDGVTQITSGLNFTMSGSGGSGGNSLENRRIPVEKHIEALFISDWNDKTFLARATLLDIG
jgi:hypothetical protein